MIEKTEVLAILRKYNYWDDQPIKMGINRLFYMEKICSLIGQGLIKVILGQRRSGKSYLMRAIINELIHAHNVPPTSILYINKEMMDFDFIADAQTLKSVIALYQAELKPVGKIYILLDEVQEIDGWERVVNAFSQDYTQDIEVFITGSNANLLSSELSTYLSGRYVTVTVYPFGYSEYLSITQQKRHKDSFIAYLTSGGMPELYHLPDQDAKNNYMQSLMDSIVLRDIIRRQHIRDVSILKKLIHFVMDSVGSYVSIPSIVKSFAQNGIKTNAETITRYLQYAQEAFFIHECQRYDLRGKHILMGERKYYLNDLSFQKYMLSNYELKINRLLENAVYLWLCRQGFQVYAGTFRSKEIDFIAERENERRYVQVAYLLTDEKVVEREFGNLAFIPDHYPKIVITLDDVSQGNINGIQHQLAWDVL